MERGTAGFGATGYLEGLTWQPRRVRLIPSAPGDCTYCGRAADPLVRTVYFQPGRSRDKGEFWQDPFVAYSEGGEKQPRPVRPQGDRPLWRDYAALFLPGPGSGPRRRPAWIVEQAATLVERLGDGLERPPELVAFVLRTDNAKVLEWRREAMPFSPRLSGDPERATVIDRVLGVADEVARLIRFSLKKLYPRGGKGNTKALQGQIGQAGDAYWSALAEPFRLLVVALDEPDSDADVLEADWATAVRASAIDAFEAMVDSFDADADALARAEEARRQFYRGLRKVLPAAV